MSVENHTDANFSFSLEMFHIEQFHGIQFFSMSASHTHPYLRNLHFMFFQGATIVDFTVNIQLAPDYQLPTAASEPPMVRNQ